MLAQWGRAVGWLRRYRTPLLSAVCVLAPLPIVVAVPTPVGRGAFLLVFMSLCWALAPWSIYVTALFPLALLPLLHLAPAERAAELYWNDAICLFLGSFVLGAALERWGLHRRIALRVVMAVARPRLILLAIMMVTAGVSMFMSNTATAALMVPLVMPLIGQLMGPEKDDEASVGATDESVGASVDGEEQPLGGTARDVGASVRAARERFCKSLLLAVAYSASLGGIGTLIGTGPNLALVQLLRVLFPEYEGLSFGAWMLFAVPLVLTCLACLWLVLVFVVNDRHSVHLVAFDVDHHRAEHAKLGRMRFEEIVVLAALVLMVLLWLTRSGLPPYLPGWSELFDDYVQDGTVCVTVAVLLFLIPSVNEPGSHILDSQHISKLHWEVVLLIGAGFAIGYAFVASGLTRAIADTLHSLRSVPVPVVVFVVVTIGSFWTEVCSNVATANILLPIVAALAVGIGQNPLILMVPVTIACSFAFMLPVATPPNALVMAAGVLQPSDMIKASRFPLCFLLTSR